MEATQIVNKQENGHLLTSMRSDVGFKMRTLSINFVASFIMTSVKFLPWQGQFTLVFPWLEGIEGRRGPLLFRFLWSSFSCVFLTPWKFSIALGNVHSVNRFVVHVTVHGGLPNFVQIRQNPCNHVQMVSRVVVIQNRVVTVSTRFTARILGCHAMYYRVGHCQKTFCSKVCVIIPPISEIQRHVDATGWTADRELNESCQHPPGCSAVSLFVVPRGQIFPPLVVGLFS